MCAVNLRQTCLLRHDACMDVCRSIDAYSIFMYACVCICVWMYIDVPDVSSEDHTHLSKY
jgi:hypothetical protein